MFRCAHSSLAVFATVLLVAATMSATTAATPAVLRVPGMFSTVSAAISAAGLSDVIYISSSITESLVLPIKPAGTTITIRRDPAAIGTVTWSSGAGPLITDSATWSSLLTIAEIDLQCSSDGSCFDFTHSQVGGDDTILEPAHITSTGVCTPYLVAFTRPATAARSSFVIGFSSLQLTSGLVTMAGNAGTIDFGIFQSTVSTTTALPCLSGFFSGVIVTPEGVDLSTLPGSVTTLSLRNNHFTSLSLLSANLLSVYKLYNQGSIIVSVTNNMFTYNSLLLIGNVWDSKPVGGTSNTKFWFAHNSITRPLAVATIIGVQHLTAGQVGEYEIVSNTFTSSVSILNALPLISDTSLNGNVRYLIDSNVFQNTPIAAAGGSQINIQSMATFCAIVTNNQIWRVLLEVAINIANTGLSSATASIYIAGNSFAPGSNPSYIVVASPAVLLANMQIVHQPTTLMALNYPTYSQLCLDNPGLNNPSAGAGIPCEIEITIVGIGSCVGVSPASMNPCTGALTGSFDNAAPTAVDDTYMAAVSPLNVLNNDQQVGTNPVELLLVPLYSQLLYALSPNPSIATGPQAGSVIYVNRVPLSKSFASGISDTFHYYITDANGGLSAATVTIMPNARQLVINDATNVFPIANGDITLQTSDGTSFGSVSVGNSATHSFLACNYGTSTLSLTGSASTSPPFSVSGLSSGTTISSGSCISFSAKYSPTSAGSPSQTATISIPSDDSVSSPYTFLVGGTATPEQYQVVNSANSMQITSSANPNSVTISSSLGTDFGIVNPTTPQSTSTFSVQLQATNPLSESAMISISNNNPSVGSFSLSSSSIVTTQGGTVSSTPLSVPVTFTGKTEGTATATVSVVLTDPSGMPTSTETFLVSAMSQSRSLQVNALIGSPTVPVSIPNGENMPTTAGGTAFTTPVGDIATETLQLCNPDSLPLTITSAPSFAPSTAYSIVGTAPTTVAAMSCQTVMVQFQPTSTGTYPATFSIGTNDPNNPTYSFALLGTGTPEQYQVVNSANSMQITSSTNPNSVTISSSLGTDFGTVATGTPQTSTFSVQLQATNPVSESAMISISNNNPAVGSFSLSSSSIVTTQGGTVSSTPLSVPVTFIGKTEGTATATVSISLSDMSGTTSVQTFQVQVHSQSQELQVYGQNPSGGLVSVPNGETMPSTSTGTVFPTANLGQPPETMNFEFCNPDSLPLSVSMISIVPSTDFSLAGSAPTTVPPMNCISTTVQFQPTSVGTRSATVSIHTNDPNTPNYSFVVQGDSRSTVGPVAVYAGQSTPIDLSTLLPPAYGNQPIDCSSVMVASQPSLGVATLDSTNKCIANLRESAVASGATSFVVQACTTMGNCGPVTVSVFVYMFQVTSPSGSANWPMYFTQTISWVTNLPTGYYTTIELVSLDGSRVYWTTVVKPGDRIPSYAPHLILPGNYFLRFTTSHTIPAGENYVWARVPTRIFINPPRRAP